MKSDKMSISLPAELAAEIRDAAKSVGVPVSRWVADAAAQRARFEAFDRFLEEWEREHGRITPEELRAAEKRWLSARVSGRQAS